MTLAPYAEESAAGFTLAEESTRQVTYVVSYGWSSTPPMVMQAVEVDEAPEVPVSDRLADLRARAHQRILASSATDWDQPAPAEIIELRPLQFETETWLRED